VNARRSERARATAEDGWMNGRTCARVETLGSHRCRCRCRSRRRRRRRRREHRRKRERERRRERVRQGWGWSIRPWGRDSRVGGLPILPAGVFASAAFQPSPTRNHRPPLPSPPPPPPPPPRHLTIFLSVLLPYLPCASFSSFPSQLFFALSLTRPPLFYSPFSPFVALSAIQARSMLSLSFFPFPPPSTPPPPVHRPRNAFQPPPTPPPPLGAQPASVPRSSFSFHLLPPPSPPPPPPPPGGATLTPPATAQTPPNRATPGLIKEQRGSASARGSPPLASLSLSFSFYSPPIFFLIVPLFHSSRFACIVVVVSPLALSLLVAS